MRIGLVRPQLWALAAVLLAVGTGCGIPATDAIDAGPPADGIIAPADANHPSGLYVYLVDHYRVRPALRTSPGGDSAQAAIELLLAGPTREESEAGVGTAIPATAGPARVTMLDHGVLRVDLAGATALSETALEQVVCTAATAGSRSIPGGGASVVSVFTPVQRAEHRACPAPVVAGLGAVPPDPPPSAQPARPGG